MRKMSPGWAVWGRCLDDLSGEPLLVELESRGQQRAYSAHRGDHPSDCGYCAFQSTVASRSFRLPRISRSALEPTSRHR